MYAWRLIHGLWLGMRRQRRELSQPPDAQHAGQHREGELAVRSLRSPREESADPATCRPTPLPEGAVTMQRYILTGAPGAGKTTILAALRDRGYAVVDEAATDVIAREHALGIEEPWRSAGFIDAIALLQRERQQQPVPPS